MSVLSMLPPLKPSNGKGLTFCQRQRSFQKAKFSMVDAKKAAKVLEGLGKAVTSIEVSPSGGFIVTALTQPSQTPPDQPKNQWDDVLND